MSRWLAAIIVTLSLSRAAAADELEVLGDACELSGLDAEVARLVTEHAPTHVRIELERSAAEVVARVSLPDRASGVRVVAAASCDELVDALGLVIAMAINGTDPTSPPPPRPVAHAEVKPEPAPQPAVVASTSVERTRPLSLGAYVAGGSAASSNGTHALAVVGTSLRRGALSLGLQMRVDAPDEEAVTSTSSVRVSRTEASLAPCLHRGAFAGCWTVAAGMIRGEGIGLRQPRSVVSPVLATGLRLVWEHPLGGAVAIRAALEAQLRLTTTELDVDFMPVWTSERIEGSGGVGLVARFL